MSRAIDIDDILDGFLTRLSAQLTSALPSVRQAVFSYGRQFMRESREDMLRWSEQASTGQLSRSDLEYLIQSKVDLLEMRGLEQTGLAKARVDEIRASMTRAALGGILGVVGI